MLINRQVVADKIASYLRHQITLGELVDWAERQMMEGELEAGDAAVVREVLARLGLADVRAFGLTWEDCEEMLRRLGYVAKVEIGAG
ncbi:MAG: hypothetical protein NTU53_02220 [Planctomycetota bacterium]|nr:hypothetical protein [Planctomycetota bacterium]